MSAFLLSGCRHDELVSYMQEEILPADAPDTNIKGLYLLNEGNMGSNKCTLDYLDLSSTDSVSHYYRNIYSQCNPHAVLELGDVGNDIAIYGSKLWIVVSCSNKVEVCEASTARRLGQIDIANCRYLAFHDGYAYVSSFAGPQATGSNDRLGWVYKVDTLTMQKVDSLTVGYQPEEMAVADGKLYVANSGGYRIPQYDNRVSVIDLHSFKHLRDIEVAINLHHILADKYGQLWVSSRGDYYTQPASLFWIKDDQVRGRLDIPISTMTLAGDSLYYISSSFSYQQKETVCDFGIVDVSRCEKLSTQLFDAPEIDQMTMPYGIVVNPIRRDFYLMDAHNYVSSGELLHFTAKGEFDWKTRTGDIPSRAVWLFASSHIGADEPQPEQPQYSPYIEAVDEYMPAPGQFVNELPVWEMGDDAMRMTQKASNAIAHNAKGLITLGGWGGYVTFHFDHPIHNVPDERDFYIAGNAVSGSSEAGIVCVSQDTNGNGRPDDMWYELSGSADVDHANIIYDYALSYTKQDDLSDTPWADNRGMTGLLKRNTFHTQEYYPLWLESPLCFTGTRLPDNATLQSDNVWHFEPFDYGYVDNRPNADTLSNSFDISWAVHPLTRQPIKLDRIDFVRVYTGLHQEAGWLGETSTEISGACDLHCINK